MGDRADFEICIEPFGLRFRAAKGTNLASFLRGKGVPLRSDCGGKGVCRKCAINVRATLMPVHACRIEIDSDLLLEIPVTSLICPSETVDKALQAGDHPLRFPVEYRPGFAIAVDLGTTTIAGFLCDLSKGVVVRSMILPNPQSVYGADVMSRIEAASCGHLRILNQLAVSAIEELALSLSRSAGILPKSIGDMIVVGNTTMLHLFLGVDPRTLGQSPFQPVFHDAQERRASDIGFNINPAAVIKTLPVVSGFVGADLVSAALAQRIGDSDDKTMLVDIGTNGEIILKANGRFYGTSCATGPAFEGATIEHGMLALSGAIDSFRLDPQGSPEYTVIGGAEGRPAKVLGICGSGLVGIASALLCSGIIEPSGRFSPDSAHPNVRTGILGQREFLLSASRENGERDIVLAQKDVRALQLAKGAISTGIEMLCRFAGCDLPEKILLAGSFGSHVRAGDLLTIGLLPAISAEKVEIVGNAAGMGAIMAAMDPHFQKKAQYLAERIEVVELASQPDFQKIFMDSLSFPGGNIPVRKMSKKSEV